MWSLLLYAQGRDGQSTEHKLAPDHRKAELGRSFTSPCKYQVQLASELLKARATLHVHETGKSAWRHMSKGWFGLNMRRVLARHLSGRALCLPDKALVSSAFNTHLLSEPHGTALSYKDVG